MRKKPLQALLLASLVLLLCSCASLDRLPAPLVVDLPEICEQILEPVPLPDVRPGDDADVAFMREDAALIEANDRIVTGRNCIRDERRAYRKDGPT